MMKKLTRKALSAGLALFLVLGSVSLSAPALASSSDLVASDVYSAKLLAKVSKHRVMVESLLAEDSTTFVNPDGTFTTDTSSSPVRVRDDGSASGWRDLDFTLVVKPDGSVGPVSGFFPLTLSNGGSAEQVAVSGVVKATGADGSVIGFGWNGVLPQPVLEGNKATYLAVLPGVDLVVEASVSGFEQFFVLAEKPSVETLQALAIPLQLRKVILVEQVDGSFSFNSSNNEVVANIQQPRVWDSSIEPLSGLPVDEAFDLTYFSDVKTLQLDGLASFFENPNLVYPVTIDPSVTLDTNGDTYVLSDTGLGYGSASELLLGTYNGGATKARAFVRFNNSTWMRKQIISATFKLYEHWSYSCNARNVSIYPAAGNLSSSTNWANQPLIADSTVKTTVSTAKGYSSSCAADWVSFDAKNIVEYFSTNYANSNSSTIAVRASETDSYGWKRFHSGSGAHPPTLSVTYNTFPQQPTLVQVAPGQLVDGLQYATSLNPTFSSLVSDSDKDKQTVSFALYADATSTTAVTKLCSVSGVVTNTTASCKAPFALADDTVYFVRASGFDGKATTTSEVMVFKTTATVPNTPSISCAGYANGSNTATATTPISCTLTQQSTAGVVDASKVVLVVDSGEPQTIPVTAGSLSFPLTLPAGSKAHVIQATAFSAQGLSSVEGAYSFSVGSAGIYWPNQVVKTSGTAKISAYVSPTSSTVTAARIDWLTNEATLFGSKTVALTSLQSFKTLQGLFDYRWNTRELFNTTGFAAYAQDGVAEVFARVCFTYATTTEKCTQYDISLLVVQHAFASSNPTTGAGPGVVSLLTGELQVGATDASQYLPEGALSISRTHLAFDGSQPSAQAVFGQGWKASFVGIDSGVASYTVADSTLKQGLLSLIDADGNALVFKTPAGIHAAQPTGTYVAAEQETVDTFATLKLDYSGSAKRLQFIEAEGRVTTWLFINNLWQLQNIVEPNGVVTNSYSYDASGRVTRILGPVPSGVSCPSGSENAGCKALLISYAASTTATTATPGNFVGQVSSISFKAFDQAAGVMKTVQVASYKYDNTGYLVQAVDPRSNQNVTYSYASNALLQNKLLKTVKQSGFAAYNFEYSTNAELLNVTRDKADGATGFDIDNSFVYNIPLAGSNLPDLSATNIALWGQKASPKYGAVVFGANQTFTNTNLNTQVDLASLNANQLKTGSFVYTDENGNTVNTASYGIDAWRYSYTKLDSNQRPVVIFDYTGIDQILDLHAQGNLTGLDPEIFATVNRYKEFIYDVNHVQTDGGQLIETWSPRRLMNVGGKENFYRLHTITNFDEGAPATKLAGGVAYGLETSKTTTISTPTKIDLTGTPTNTGEVFVAETVTGYNPVDGTSNISNTSGWILRKPTSTQILDADGNTVATNQVFYDGFGRTTKTVGNGSNGADSLTDNYIYYTTGANQTVASCGNKPAWNGLLCFVGSTTTSVEKPNRQITFYDYYLKPTITIESTNNGSVTRTTTLTYYPDNATGSAGKLNTTEVTVSGVANTNIDKAQNLYDTTTGLLTKTQTLNTASAITSSISYTYDLWGRKTSTTNQATPTATPDVSTITYLAYGQIGAGQISAVTTNQNTLLYSYGATNTSGFTETRSIPTGLTVSGIGTYTAEYNQAGQQTLQTAPGTVNQTFDYDATGQLKRMAYSSMITVTDGTVTITSRDEWFENTRNYDPQSRVKTETTPAENPATDGSNTQTYSYDTMGRLTTVTDNGDLTCSNRNYTFDTQGNRTGKTSKVTAATDGECDTTLWVTTNRNLTYNKYSQITSTGYIYDALGRNTTLPAVDSPNNTQLTFEYASDNRITKQTSGTTTYSYTFDALGRRVNEATKVGSAAATTTTRHYTGDNDNPTWVTSATQTDTFTPSLGSALNATKTVAGSTTTKTLQIGNLHGDTLTSVTIPATGAVTPPQQLNLFDEYGLPKPTLNPTSNPFILNYGSLGQAQRETSDTGITLMGVRGYNPVTGQFLTPDPIPGGNETSYNCLNDPINKRDLSGAIGEDDGVTLAISAITTAITFVGCLSLVELGPFGCIALNVVVGAINGLVTEGYKAHRDKLSKAKTRKALAEGLGLGAVSGLVSSLVPGKIGSMFKIDQMRYSIRYGYDLVNGKAVDIAVQNAYKTITRK